MKQSNIVVRHDQQHGMFYIKLNGSAARLNYSKPEMDVMNITKTHVPERSRNLGLGKRLVRHTLDFALSYNIKVIPSCSFVENYIKNNKEYSSILVP